jgi:hypothetical protein
MTRSSFVALSVALCLHFTGPAQADVAVRTIALSGDPVPGVSGATFSSFASAGFQFIDGGRAAFVAKLSVGPGGVTSSSDSGLWSEKGGPLNLVVREGMQAPGVPAGAVFGEVSQGNWNSSGSLGLNTKLLAGAGGVTANNDSGVWSDAGGSLQLVAREGDAAPGTSAGVVFGDAFKGPVLNESGSLVFTGSLKTGTGAVTVDNNEGIWVMRGAPLALVVREGQQAPGGPVGAIMGQSDIDLNTFSYPAIDAAGHVAFTGYMVIGPAGVTINDRTGFWTERSGPLQLTYRAGMQAPGAAPGVKIFSYAGFPYTNSSGRLSGQQILTGGDVTDIFTNGIGVYNDANGPLVEIARGGQQAPGVEAGTVFSFLSPPSFNDSGKSSFFANLRNAANNLPATINEGIWSDATGTLKLVVREGDAATGVGAGAVIGPIDSSAYRPILNDAGQTAIALNLLQGVGGVTAANDKGYWAQDLSGNFHLLVREGDQLTVAPGVVRTIATFGLNGDARGFQFDNLGNLMFLANFTDGSQGLFVVNASVPEPSAMVGLLALCSIASCSLRVRFRKHTDA